VRDGAVVPGRISSVGVLIQRKGKRGKESTSFLKKRSKKLLSIADGTESGWMSSALASMNKGFLVLFFKKERPSFAP
jgi:hypothetical protein